MSKLTPVSDPRRIFVRGSKRTVEWAETQGGKQPAKEFYESLPPKKKAQILTLVKHFAEHGRITNTEKFKKVQDGLWEFKSYQVRFLGDHRSGRRFVLALGLKKKRNKHRSKDLSKAHRILAENDQREST